MQVPRGNHDAYSSIDMGHAIYNLVNRQTYRPAIDPKHITSTIPRGYNDAYSSIDVTQTSLFINNKSVHACVIGRQTDGRMDGQKNF